MNGFLYLLAIAFFFALVPLASAATIDGCAVVNTSTSLTSNLLVNGSCIVINANNSILNCTGFSINGNSTGIGINATDLINVTIKDCFIENFSNNIFLNGTNNSFIINNTARNASAGASMRIIASHNNLIANNNNRGNSASAAGISFSSSNNNTFANNTITAATNTALLFSTGSSNNLLTNNTVSGTNADAIAINGGSNNTLTNNNVPLPTSGVGIQITNSDNAMLINNTVTVNTTDAAISVIGSNNTFLDNNTATNVRISTTSRGFKLQGPFKNATLINSIARTADGSGGSAGSLALTIGANNSHFINNTFVSDAGIAIHLASPFGDSNQNNTFSNNTLFTNNTWILVDSITSGTMSNNFTNTLFEGANGSIRILPNFTVPVSTNVSIKKLNIFFNAAFLNSTNLSFLNTSAEITLRNITFANPEPRVDVDDDGTFTACPSAICTELAYAGGEYTFNVTHFTAFSSSDSNPNVTLIKTENADPVNSSSFFTYQITINNTGTANASNLTLTDTYPAQVIFNNSQPTALAGTNDTFIIGNLSAGSSITVNITVFVGNFTTTVTLNNTANISFRNGSFALVNVSVNETTNVSAAASSPSSPAGQGGGSGGGGGGGVSSSRTFTMTGETATFTLRRTDKVIFTANTLKHTLTVQNIAANQVQFSVASIPQTFTLAKGASTLVDTDSDGTDDLRVTVASIAYLTATLRLELLSAPATQPTATTTPAAAPETKADQPSTPAESPALRESLPVEVAPDYKPSAFSFEWIFYGSAALALLGLCVWYYVRSRKK